MTAVSRRIKGDIFDWLLKFTSLSLQAPVLCTRPHSLLLRENPWKQTRGGGYSHTLPIQVPAAQRGRDFEASDLEWGIHFRGVL